MIDSVCVCVCVCVESVRNCIPKVLTFVCFWPKNLSWISPPSQGSGSDATISTMAEGVYTIINFKF